MAERLFLCIVVVVVHEATHYGHTLQVGSKVVFSAIFLGTYASNRARGMNHNDAYNSIPSEAMAQVLQAVVFEAKKPRRP